MKIDGNLKGRLRITKHQQNNTNHISYSLKNLEKEIEKKRKEKRKDKTVFLLNLIYESVYIKGKSSLRRSHRNLRRRTRKRSICWEDGRIDRGWIWREARWHRRRRGRSISISISNISSWRRRSRSRNRWMSRMLCGRWDLLALTGRHSRRRRRSSITIWVRHISQRRMGQNAQQKRGSQRVIWRRHRRRGRRGRRTRKGLIRLPFWRQQRIQPGAEVLVLLHQLSDVGGKALDGWAERGKGWEWVVVHHQRRTQNSLPAEGWVRIQVLVAVRIGGWDRNCRGGGIRRRRRGRVRSILVHVWRSGSRSSRAVSCVWVVEGRRNVAERGGRRGRCHNPPHRRHLRRGHVNRLGHAEPADLSWLRRQWLWLCLWLCLWLRLCLR